jgi:hypothetical protein
VLASVDNRNQTYLLTAFTSDGGRPRVRLCLGAAEIASHGWGRPPDEGSISFLLRGALADRAAAALHLDRRDRHPLGLGMRWRFVVPARVRAGVPATVVLVGENSGSETVFFDTGGVHLGWNPDHRHRFGVWLDGKLPPDGEGRVNLDGVVTRVEPGPGGESRFEEPLERWPALERPGSYRVICRFETELHPSGEPADWARTDLAWDVVYESEATVEVVP